MSQVDPVPMSSDAASVAAAFVEAYTQLRGYPPPRKESWLWPLALSANETASWRDPRTAENRAGLYNWNLGNVTSTGSGDWYYDPAVTSALKFVSYPDAVSGALGELKILDRLGGVAAADAGDWDAWNVALSKYLGSNYPDISGIVNRLSAVVPSNAPASSGGGGGFVLPPKPVLLAAGAILVFGAWATWTLLDLPNPLRKLGFA